MKLYDLLFESKQTNDKFEEFAETRGKGAAKIATTAEEKGGLALLTWHHFKVKAAYYRRATAGKFDIDSAKKEPLMAIPYTPPTNSPSNQHSEQ